MTGLVDEHARPHKTGWGKHARAKTLAMLLGPAGLGGCDKPDTTVELASVADAPAHFEASRLSFRGEVRPELLGSHTWRSRAGNGRGVDGNGPAQWMFVVPVVPEGWTPDQPVPMWLTPPGKATRDGDATGWLTEAQGIATTTAVGLVRDYAGRKPGIRTVSAWQKAIQETCAQHQIRSDPHAPVVVWPDPS